ncbi:uncharacterized protein N7483_002476 [Penicillium malachiteum]|uniref:uncharacterized protein n=1 Tax=Penicillium malachiteum TaxID=1324776 RepID=UPI0025489430|nr:uncharacterized protein N7483_002476 [Penicillium malachiteum]KAJ5737351.1 hypothetical protein N7483_002476 [Penicillium malachiteum]
MFIHSLRFHNPPNFDMTMAMPQGSASPHPSEDIEVLMKMEGLDEEYHDRSALVMKGEWLTRMQIGEVEGPWREFSQNFLNSKQAINHPVAQFHETPISAITETHIEQSNPSVPACGVHYSGSPRTNDFRVHTEVLGGQTENRELLDNILPSVYSQSMFIPEVHGGILSQGAFCPQPANTQIMGIEESAPIYVDFTQDEKTLTSIPRPDWPQDFQSRQIGLPASEVDEKPSFSQFPPNFNRLQSNMTSDNPIGSTSTRDSSMGLHHLRPNFDRPSREEIVNSNSHSHYLLPWTDSHRGENLQELEHPNDYQSLGQPHFDQINNTSVTRTTSLSQPEPPSMPYARSPSNETLALIKLPYSKLIFNALSNAKGHRLCLSDIYAWFKNNTNRPQGNWDGWKNSIRHNLSVNEAFTSRRMPDQNGELVWYWCLTDKAIRRGTVDPTCWHRKDNGYKTKKRK